SRGGSWARSRAGAGDAQRSRPPEGVRGRPRRRRRELRPAARRGPRADRAERRRQDDRLQRAGGPAPAGRGRGAPRRRADLRALANDPAGLLLDEPTAGMAPAERGELMRLIVQIARAGGQTVLFTEHDMDIVWSVADRILVLHQGRVIAEGLPGEIRANPGVQQVYLG